MSDFELHGKSGNWTAASTDCEGWGRTRKAAIADALRMRRGNAIEADRMDRDEGVVRDEYGFAVYGPACECADGPDADTHGTCRVCGGHD
jgi:hypothetical protein